MDLHYYNLTIPELEDSLLSLKMKRSRIGSFASHQILQAIEQSIMSIEMVLSEKKTNVNAIELFNKYTQDSGNEGNEYRDQEEFQSYSVDYDPTKGKYPTTHRIKKNDNLNDRTIDNVYEEKATEYLDTIKKTISDFSLSNSVSEDSQQLLAKLLLDGHGSIVDIERIENELTLRKNIIKKDDDQIITNIPNNTYIDVPLSKNKSNASSHQAVLDIARRQFKKQSNINSNVSRNNYINKRSDIVIDTLKLSEEINSRPLNDPIRRSILKMVADEIPLEVYNKEWPLTELLRGPYWPLPPILQNLKSPRTHVKLLLPPKDYNHQAVGRLIDHLTLEFDREDQYFNDVNLNIDSEEEIDDEI